GQGRWALGRYQPIPCQPAAAGAFRLGRNLLAVHCRHLTEGCGIDVGLYADKGPEPWIERLTAMLVHDPTNRHLVKARSVGMGDRCAAEKAWERAIAEYSKAVAADPDDVALLLKRAEACAAAKAWDRAQADWSNLAKKQPGSLQNAFARYVG